MRRTAFLKSKYWVIKLTADLKWQSENELRQKQAYALVPIEYSEGDGDPHAFLISKLQKRIGGEVGFEEDE